MSQSIEKPQSQAQFPLQPIAKYLERDPWVLLKLEALIRQKEYTRDELSRLMGIPRSTCYDYLQTINAKKYKRKTKSRGRPKIYFFL
ncbi:MAG: helix-turn-helix domain-containing protein [Promethearchaeota archaeon]